MKGRHWNAQTKLPEKILKPIMQLQYQKAQNLRKVG